MTTTKIYIKNMVCSRCIQVVKSLLKDLQVEIQNIQLGWADIILTTDSANQEQIETTLQAKGFELLKSKEEQIVEQIKINLLTYLDSIDKHKTIPKVSSFLAEEMKMSYTHLSRLFSHHENVTIERYSILLKIERVKELLSYDEYTLSEIAYRLGYSSVNHLSSQFKKVTGITVSEFKSQPYIHRHDLDSLA